MTEEKNIKDYLHLYLGCGVSIVLGEFTLIGIEHKEAAIVYNKIYGRKVYASVLIKPILRPLSDMSEEEAQKASVTAFEFKVIQKNILSYAFTPTRFLWLLSKHFDLFGLIEAGLAIDKTTLKL